jgi:hypothetical protein
MMLVLVYFINQDKCAIAVQYVSYFYQVNYYFMFSMLFIVIICNIDIMPCMYVLYVYICLCLTCSISDRSDNLVYDRLNEK